MTKVPVGLLQMTILPTHSLPRTRGNARCLRKGFASISLVLVFGCLHVFAQPQQTTPGEERVKQILQTLEADNSLRHALEQGGRGDGVHYWWMDLMRRFAIKQVSFRVQFQYPNVKFEHPVGPDDLKVTSTKYLLRYYRYDTPITSGSTLDQIRASGLEDGVTSEILRRSRVFLEQTSDPQSMGTCGTLFVNLLDDEVLPILDEPAQRRKCESSAKENAKQTPGEDRVKQVLQTLEADNTLRHALEQGMRGDGIHYWWMDVMSQFGVKQAAFNVQFKYPAGKKDLKVTDIKYLQRYYRYDTPITSDATLDQIRASGLEDGVRSAILHRARNFLNASNWGSEEFCGTLYVNLLDDEVLPILDEPTDRDACESSAKVSAARPPQNVRLTSKRTRHTARPRTPPPPVVSEETYHKVLDRVFSRDILQDDRFDYVFVLRYEPPFGAESQITIAERDGKIEVVKYTTPESIERKLNRLVALTSGLDIRRMARQIKIKKERLSVAAKDLKLLRENFFEKLRISERTHPETLKNENTVAAEETGYRLWYSGEIEIYSNFAGSNLMTPTRSDESPLLDWMKGVYFKVGFPSTARR